jgi:hypothetical protein
MADAGLRRRIAPSVPLTLDLEDDSGAKFTRSFKLCFDFNAIALVEDESGYSLLDGEIWKHPTAKNLSIMFYAAALAQHPEYEGHLDVIRSLMDAGNVEKITRALNEAFINSLPKEKQDVIRKAQSDAEAKGANPTPAPAETSPAADSNGSTSGPSLVTT